MTLQTLLATLAASGIQLRGDGEELVVTGNENALDADLVRELRAHKATLRDFVRENGGWWAPRLITPEMLPLVTLSQAEIDAVVAGVEGGARNVQDIYPLAPLQEGILFHHLLKPEADPYLLPSLHGFGRREQLDAYLSALQAVIDRHDILRTSVAWEGLPEPVQVVWRRVRLAVEEVELDAAEAEDAAGALWDRLDPRRAGLDLRRAPVMRACVARDRANDRWLLLLLRHHLISDHTTLEVMEEEIRAHLQGREADLPAPLPFRNFVAQARLGASRAEHEAFFRALLGDVAEPTAPFGLLDAWGDGSGIEAAQQWVEPGVDARLRSRARALGVSLASVCHVAWGQVLERVTGQDDVVFGTLLFGRMQAGEGADRTMGLFMNTLPVRMRLGAQGAEASVRAMHRQLAELLRHEHASLALAQRCSGVEAPAPLFTSTLNYRHNPGAKQTRAAEASASWGGMRRLRAEERTNYPVGLAVTDLGDEMVLTAQAPGSVGAARVCALMHRALEALAEALESAPERAVGALDVLPESERRLVVEEWNRTEAEYPRDVCVHELFEAQAERTPGAAAAVFEDASLTYAELNARANRLAHHLRALGVRPEARVAICAERSLEMAVGLLAVMKAGGAYVPLDPGYPAERLRHMLDDSRPVVLLTQAALSERLAAPGIPVLALDADAPAWASRPETNPPRAGLTPEHPAYVIYTSGSTGAPKGVVSRHRAVANLLAWGQEQWRLEPGDATLHALSFSFEVSVREIFGALVAGARVVLARPGGQRDPAYLLEAIRRYGVSVLIFPPSQIQAFLQEPALDRCTSLRWLVTGGDSLAPEQVRELFRRLPGVRFHHEYGPTETTIASTVQEYGAETGGSGASIGRPVWNTRVYLLDRRDRPVPVGVAGEIHVGGAGVARGYLDRPAATAARFVPDPFGGEPGARLYRTGDLGRRRADGTLEFLGRDDFQVKIRGFRVELGEVEARLREHEGVREAVVAAREDAAGDRRLVAYFVSGAALDVEALRRHAAERLPEHMIPAAYVRLEALPLTPSGKVDRKALPAPEDDAYARRGYEAPVGETEAALAEIWSEVLGVERVGRWDHFFQLGGHSLLIVRLTERMRRRGLHADVGTLFTTPVLAELARAVSGETLEAVVPANAIPADAESITPEMLPLVALGQADVDRIVAGVEGGAPNVQDVYPLAPLQEGILFHHLLAREGDPYLASSLYGFERREQLDAYVGALQAVIDRHDILRTPVAWEGLPEPVQVVWRRARLRVETVELDAGEDARTALWARFDPRRTRLDLRRAPLMRAALAHDPANGRWLLLVQEHHLIGDHTTLEVLREEIRAHQQGRQAELTPPLPFRNFVAQARLGVSPAEHEAFFRALLGDVDEPTAPFGALDVWSDGTGVDLARRKLEPELAARLRSRARALGVSAASVCHVAWGQVLARATGRGDVVFGTVLFGRMGGGEGADRAMGIFMNMLPVRVRVGADGAEASVRGMHRQLAELLRHEHASLALAQRSSGVEAPAPLFTSFLNYRHNAATDQVRSLKAEEEAGGMHRLQVEDRSNYPVALSVNDSEDGLELSAQAPGSVGAARVCALMHRALEALVEALESAPERAVAALDVLPQAERRRVVEEWNRTEAEYPRDACVHELFEARAARAPGAPAVVFGGTELTYAELNARANRLAHHLRALGVGPDARVAICVERSPEMVVAVLAVLKAGGAYVPLDPGYPAERLRHMLSDSAPTVVLTQSSIAATQEGLFAGLGAEVLDLDAPSWEDQAATNPERAGLTPGHLAYVIYTSGSTGTPKGVMVAHRNVAGLVEAQARTLGVDPESRVLQFASFSFDASVFEMVMALCQGASLHVVPGADLLAGQALERVVADGRITHVTLPPAVLPTLSETADFSSIQTMVLAGEALPEAAARRWAGGRRLINAYGPTEAAVWATFHECRADEAGSPPIGRPIPNARVYLLDEAGEPVPAAVAGELYIGGAGVARGYLGRPELTAERFVADPFGGEPGARLYRTGDLARWRADGTLEFLGRNDFQVKIRGFRVELGEIEARLAEHPSVREAAVMARADGADGPRLVAYYVADEPVEVEALRRHAGERLPDYMVPAAYVQMEALPLTPSGKLDRRALPSPEESAYARRGHEAPRGETEQALAEIWSEVLGVEQVGRWDDFFELGGHSILAVLVVTRIQQVLGVELTPGDVFERPVLKELAEALAIAGRAELPPIERVDRSASLPLSFAQQRLWFLEQMGDLGSTYHVALRLRLLGALDRDALRRALDRLVARHEALRTTFPARGGAPEQRIAPETTRFPLAERDLAGAAPGELDRVMDGEVVAPFDLGQGPLIRGVLIRLADDDHVLLLTMHHIVADGWSMGVLVDELGQLYAAFRAGRPDPLAPLPVQYADYAAWQRRGVEAEVLESQGAYWRQALSGAPALLDLPTDRPRPQRRDHAGASLRVELDEALTEGLKELGRRHGTTLFMTLMAGWATVLARLSGQEQVVIGTPTANRGRPEVEGLIGFFINTLALRVDLSQRPTVAGLLEQVKARALEAQRNQDIPFEQVVEILDPVRTLAHTPLFQVLFSWQNAPRGGLELPGLRLGQVPGAQQTTAKFDLTLALAESGGRVAGSLEYATSLFERATVERYVGYLRRVLEQMAADGAPSVDRLELLPEAERRQVVEEWNRTEAYPAELCIHQRFEAQVERTPGAVAVSFDGATLTYAQLNARANRLAHHLRALGVGPDAPVGICVERGVEMIVGVLAVLKAGGGYVPLDPAYPEERLRHALEDSAPAAVLTQDSLRGLFAGAGLPVIALDGDAPSWAGLPDTNPQVAGLAPHHLAYVIYTSGSTGQPKGVMVEHRNVARLFSATDAWFGFGERDVWTLFHSFAFDFSVWEIWGALLYGGRLVVVPRDTARSPDDFYALVCREGVTVLNQTPSAFRQLIAAQAASGAEHALRCVVFGGEALELATLRPWFERNDDQRTRLVNMYGITETTVHVTYRPVFAADAERAGPSPIGVRLPDLTLYVLDAHGRPVPVGVTGELYVGGAGVARGYLNRPELTAERFVRDPFSTDPGARLYRTGDLGRWLADGTLEYLGRNDSQVKVRGFRIELGEIEARLAQHPGVREAVVVARRDEAGDTGLVAYFVGEEDAAPEALRQHLHQQLPEHMVPAAYVRLRALPLTPSGKLDHAALPAPEGDAYARRGYEAPVGPVETAVAEVWAELLRVDRVSRHDNFFELGGHSLLAMTLIEHMRRRGVPADVRTLFTAPTLAALAEAIGEQAVGEQDAGAGDPRTLPAVAPNGIPAGCAAITPEMLPLVQLDQASVDRIVATVPGGAANVQDVYPLLPLQEGILFHHLLAAEGDPYLLANAFGFDSRARLDAFLDGLRFVIGRHDILRTAVLWEDLPEPVQVVWRDAPLHVEEVELDAGAGDAAGRLLERFSPRHTRLDLRRAPLMRGYAARGETPGSWVLLLLQHHMIDDNTSLKRIFAEIRAHAAGLAEELPAPVPFRDFVAQARRDADPAQDEAFFRGLLGDVTEPTAPFGLLDARGDGTGVHEASLFVHGPLSDRLRLGARALGVGVATLCHVAYSLVLARVSGRDDVVFGTVLFGRMQGGEGADRAMGMFINTLPVRVRIGGEGAAAAVRRAHALLADLLRHEHASLALAQRCSGVAAPAPLFSALLNYRHAAGAAAEPASAAPPLEGIRRLVGQERTNYPLSVAVDDLGDGFRLSAKVLAPVQAERVCEMMRAALEGLAGALESAPEAPLATIDVLPADERRRVVEEWNTGRFEYPADACVHELFEAQVERTPGATAVVFEDATLNYAELNRRANRLAHRLRELGVGPDTRVGLCVERSLEMVVGVLGVLKAGGAWVPLDPGHPEERLRYMLGDSGAAVVLARGALAGLFADAGVPVVDVDVEDASRPETNPGRGGLTPAHLAYVIYTSGSTGLPKGVMVAHGGVVNLVHWMKQRWPMDESHALLQKTPLGFDVSVWELFWPLVSGARLVVARPEGHKDPAYLAETIRRERITAVAFVPSMLQVFLDDPAVERCATLKWVMSGGEALSGDLVRRLHERLPAAELYNRYAPTEATVNVLAWRCGDEAGASVPVGRPRENIPIYLLDAAGQPVPLGVTGELYIGGVQVARGYQGRPELTAERFVADPYGREPGARLYRTGDLARWRVDGAVELVGRNDFQVKVRGLRIELGEIEARLREHPSVREGVVLARDDAPGDRRLVAYCVADEPVDVEALRRHMGERLPDYMVPAAYVRLQALPLTPNGKLDRRALPAPEEDAYARRDYEAPVGETEQALAEIWSELLGVERVGRQDDFFELGGHSLLIVRLIERMRRRGLHAEVGTLFTTPVLARLAEVVSGQTFDVAVPANAIPAGCEAITPEMLPLVSLAQADVDRIVARVEGGAGNVQDIYPLAPLQEGILFHHLLNRDGDPYVQSALFGFERRDQLDAYLAALQAVIDRHDTLRTAVVWEGLPEAVQVVWRRARLEVEEVELDPAEGDPGDALWARFDPQRARLDIQRAPLMRVGVARDAAHGRWLLLHQKHHLSSDHTSLEVLQEEIRAHVLGRQAELPAPLPFRNFVAQTRLGVKQAEHEAFFRGLLGDVDEPTAPFGLLDVRGDGSDAESAHQRLEPAVEARLRARARALGVSAASMCHVAWGQVLARVTGRDDVVYGTVLFGRMQGGEGADRTMGPFINTLPVRVRVGAQGAEACVRRMHQELALLLRHEHASLGLAQRCSGVEAPAPLFTSILNFRHTTLNPSPSPEARAETRGGLRLLRRDMRTNYPVQLSVDDYGEALGISAHVPASVGAARVCALMHRALEALVEALETAPGRAVATLDVLPEAERRLMVEEWNRTDAEYPRESCIHELFEAQVERAPDAVAVVSGDAALSYGELNRRANRLAHHLRGAGVRPDTRVGLCVERGLDTMVAILGALKAGGTYVPLDPGYPVERLRYMLADSRPAVLLTRASIAAALPGLFEGVEVEVLDLDAPAWEHQPDTDPERGELAPDHLAYVIYTSGSTGTPKGAMVHHRGFVNMVACQTREFGISARDSVLIATSYSFDVTQRNLLGPLSRGGQVHLAAEPFDARAIAALIREHRLTFTNMTPTPFHALIDAAAGQEPLGLRLVALGGEVFRQEKLVELAAPRPGFVNTYGPTECTGAMLFNPVPDVAACGDGPVPLGRPIANCRIYLLDDAGRPVPVGVVGEIHIGGVQVARGYHGRPELTAERFVADPFGGVPGARLYRTGDLARWRVDGRVEFAGRNDFQVKIRGFRVELGEIEARLREHPAVRDAVVVAREAGPGDQRLVAYWVGEEGAAGAEALRRHVGERLPDYMVPAAYIHLEAFPATPSGKLDRRALPSPEGDAFARRAYEAPEGEVEEALAEIWSEVLGVERVGRWDSFFELGGHSLLIVRVASRIRQALGVEVELGMVFERPVLASLAEGILDVQLAQFDPEELAGLVSSLGGLGFDGPPAFQSPAENHDFPLTPEPAR